MSHLRPPLSKEEENQLENVRSNPSQIEWIISEETLNRYIELTEKYFQKSQDRKYVTLQSILAERLKFVIFARKDRKNGRNFSWKYMSHIKNIYDTILDRRQDNTNILLEAIDKLQIYIKDNTITTLIRLNTYADTAILR